jgi:hypothetical protein
MTPNDEIDLNAYLDGELDATEQARIAAAIRLDPALASRARELADVRDLLAGLSRPAAPDVSALVLARIESARDERSRSIARGRSARVFAWGLGLAATAALWLTMIYVGSRSGRPQGPAVATVHTPRPPETPPVPVEELPDVLVAADPDVPPPAPPEAYTPSAVEPEPTVVASFTEEEVEQAGTFALSLLSHEEALRVDVKLGGKSVGDLDEAVAASPRGEPEFGRIELPGNPPGVVFALVANGPELELLLKGLRRHFGTEAVGAERLADRGLVLDLAEAGNFLIERGLHAEVLGQTPPEVVASKAERDADPEGTSPVPSPRLAPDPVLATPPAGRMVVLIWPDSGSE